MSDLIERLRKRAEEDRQCAENSKAVMEALSEQIRLFETREGHNVYAVRMAVDHRNGMERDNRYADDLEGAADRITALEKENERFRGALTAIAEAWDETDEWDGTNKFNASRDVARTALRDGGGE